MKGKAVKKSRLLMPAWVILALVLSEAPKVAAANRPTCPNVLIVLTDDQGYGDLSCHGNPILRTPNLDRLHDESVRLTDFHVAPVCTPTRSQLLTGVDNLRNRACQWAYGLEYVRRDLPTMADIFARAGYRTSQFGKWHLGDNYPHRPSDRGFRESVRFGGASILQTPDYWDSDGFDDFYWHNDVQRQYHGYCTDVFFHEAMRVMKESRSCGKPFLVYLPTPAVHAPCFVADKYRVPYRNRTFHGRPLPPNVQSFFGMIANFDENMGRLEAFLVREGLKDDTILLFMSDNGGTQGVEIYTAGMRGWKGTLWEGGHRQSCFLRWPAGNLRPPSDVAGPTEIQDLLPTLIELCGVQKPADAKFDGISLAPLLRGEKQNLDRRMLVVQWAGASLRPDDPVPKGDAAVLWKRWRLTGGKKGFSQLNDLDTDPLQQKNLFDNRPDVVERMRARYEAWWRDLQPALGMREYFHVGNPAENPVTLTCFDYVEHRQLRAEGNYNLTIQPDVRRGMRVHGRWRLVVDSPGEYRLALRRWPIEADAPITAGLPMQKLADPYPDDGTSRQYWYGAPLAGKSLPVATAKVRFGRAEQTVPVRASDKQADFTFILPARGEIDLETWFFDTEGKEICSAPYAEVCKR